jgi:hypothetical protein
MRANVTDQHADTNKFAWRLVPGELMFEYDTAYFDERTDPPPMQKAELLYYAPCARCGRASNDDACRCWKELLAEQVAAEASRQSSSPFTLRP